MRIFRVLLGFGNVDHQPSWFTSPNAEFSCGCAVREQQAGTGHTWYGVQHNKHIPGTWDVVSYVPGTYEVSYVQQINTYLVSGITCTRYTEQRSRDASAVVGRSNSPVVGKTHEKTVVIPRKETINTNITTNKLEHAKQYRTWY